MDERKNYALDKNSADFVSIPIRKVLRESIATLLHYVMEEESRKEVAESATAQDFSLEDSLSTVSTRNSKGAGEEHNI